MSVLDRNRLDEEASPYLRQHADNPVNWQPWDEAALEAARETDRPIFLSIGYSACHWCHVMEEESFADDEVAEVLNEAFVPIKVDREERPDVDSVYMTVCQLVTGRGGWPLSAFLTPDGRPFYVGTYFPPEPRQGMPGFEQLCRDVAGAWNDPEDRRGVHPSDCRACPELGAWVRRACRGPDAWVRCPCPDLGASVTAHPGGLCQDPSPAAPYGGGRAADPWRRALWRAHRGCPARTPRRWLRGGGSRLQRRGASCVRSSCSGVSSLRELLSGGTFPPLSPNVPKPCLRFACNRHAPRNGSAERLREGE